MFTSPAYPTPSAQEIDAFVGEQFCGRLIATDAQGYPQVSLLPFVREGDAFEVHMVQDDPTCVALRHAGRGAFLFDEPLAFTPHHVVSDAVASFATLHFRAVLFRVDATVSLDPADVAAALERLLARYEAGARWETVADGPTYGPSLRRLACARLRIIGAEAKFKVAQNRTPTDRARLLAFLHTRGLEGDARAARLIRAAAPRPGDPA